MARVSMVFRSGTSTVRTVLRQCIQVDISIYNTKAIRVRVVVLFQKIEFNLISYIEMGTRKTRRKLIC
jgi:hypothetical protein